MKRREFVTGSIVAGAAAWLTPAAAKAAETLAGGLPASLMGSEPQAPMTRAWFEGLVGSSVELTQDRDEPVRATVAAVARRPARKLRPNNPDTDQFTVVFSMKTSAPFNGLCWMTCADGSRHQVFFGRVRDAGSEFVAQAHFSLLM
jgi:hypothetical protein